MTISTERVGGPPRKGLWQGGRLFAVAAVALPAIVYILVISAGYDGRPYLRGDAQYYYYTAVSLTQDFDLDLANQLPPPLERHDLIGRKIVQPEQILALPEEVLGYFCGSRLASATSTSWTKRSTEAGTLEASTTESTKSGSTTIRTVSSMPVTATSTRVPTVRHRHSEHTHRVAGACPRWRAASSRTPAH